jgi:hypothetical protein
MGGSAPSIPQRNLTSELGQTFGAFKKQELPAYQNFVGNEPLLSGANNAAMNWLLPVLNSGGALTPEQDRDVTQATRAGFAARGNVTGNQALGAELLNRDQYRQQRFGTALSQVLGTEQAQVGDFATLLNPLLNYGSDLYSSNQNAAAAQSIAGANKSSGALGGGLGALGSIAGAAGVAL